MRVKTFMGLDRFEVGKKTAEFSILWDLQRNLIFGLTKLCCFFPSQEVTYIKNLYSTIEVLPMGFHLNIWQFWGQNRYGCKEVLSSFSSDLGTFMRADRRIDSKLLKVA